MSTTIVERCAELRVAKAPGELVIAIIVATVVSTFLVLAARNLVNHVAIVPSVPWIGMTGCVLIAGIKENGAAGQALSILESFSHTQILLVRDVGDSTNLEIGFALFGTDIIHRRVAASDPVSVGWRAGQASDMAGRDANDWSVALWYRHHDPRMEARRTRHRFRRPDQILLIIGPSGSRVATEHLGRRIVAFLQDAGISVTLENEDRPPSDSASQ